MRFLALSLICTLFACSTTGTATAPDGGTPDSGAPDSGSPDSGTPDGGTAACVPATPFDGGTQSLAGQSVTATLVDETGAPVAAGQPLFISGLDLSSSPGQVTSGGAASISNDLTEKLPAFKFGDAINYAEFAIPLITNATNFNNLGTGKLATARLSDKPGAALTAGADAVSGDVTVSIPAGAAIGIDTLIYTTADQQQLRTASIPLTNLGQVLPATPTGFGLVFGVAPTETIICPRAKITVAVPAALGWAAGSAVEFWVTTTDVGQTYAPYAGWARVSGGTVSADGKTASSTDGFPVLENFAVRLVTGE
jgi:hypothetical protein